MDAVMASRPRTGGREAPVHGPARRMIGAALLAAPLMAAGLSAPARAADPAAGKQVFQSQCAICHSDQSGVNKIGPSLFGVVDRHTGSEPGYDYSVANKNANLVWTPAELDLYIAHPQKIVPGTKMPYGGLHNATKRANLIAFLETLKAPGAVAGTAAPAARASHVVGQVAKAGSSNG
jgi:cytochrome c